MLPLSRDGEAPHRGGASGRFVDLDNDGVKLRAVPRRLHSHGKLCQKALRIICFSTPMTEL